MNEGEYAKMYALEGRYWWFVARRHLALELLGDGGSGMGDGARPTAPPGERGTGNGERSGATTEPPNHRTNDPNHRTTEPPTLLDLGCGTGVLLSEAADAWTATGADFSPLALAFCRERGLTRLVAANGETLPLADGSFDAVVALDVFEHIPDDVAAFAEAYRVLRPGGRLVLSVPAFRWLWGPHDVALHHHRRYRASEVRRRLEDAGFRVERLSYAIFLLFPLVILSRVLEKRRRGPARASLPRVGDGLNDLLIRLLGAEGRWILAGARLPWGSSVVAVGRK